MSLKCTLHVCSEPHINSLYNIELPITNARSYLSEYLSEQKWQSVLCVGYENKTRPGVREGEPVTIQYNNVKYTFNVFERRNHLHKAEESLQENTLVQINKKLQEFILFAKERPASWHLYLHAVHVTRPLRCKLHVCLQSESNLEYDIELPITNVVFYLSEYLRAQQWQHVLAVCYKDDGDVAHAYEIFDRSNNKTLARKITNGAVLHKVEEFLEAATLVNIEYQFGKFKTFANRHPGSWHLYVHEVEGTPPPPTPHADGVHGQMDELHALLADLTCISQYSQRDDSTCNDI